MDCMLVNSDNRYDIADWCGVKFAGIWRDGRGGVVIKTIYGNIHAFPGDLVYKTPYGFDVFTKKFDDTLPERGLWKGEVYNGE
jgi:hypothetical protein